MHVDTTGLRLADSDLLVVLLTSLSQKVKNWWLTYQNVADPRAPHECNSGKCVLGVVNGDVLMMFCWCFVWMVCVGDCVNGVSFFVLCWCCVGDALVMMMVFVFFWWRGGRKHDSAGRSGRPPAVVFRTPFPQQHQHNL